MVVGVAVGGVVDVAVLGGGLWITEGVSPPVGDGLGETGVGVS